MNYDQVWQNIRYLLIAALSAAVAVGVVKSEQQSLLMALISQLDTAIPAIAGLVVMVYGNYVKWGTTPVEDVVIEKKNIPAVSGLTGQTMETKK